MPLSQRRQGLSPRKRRSIIPPGSAETPVSSHSHVSGTPHSDDVFMDVPENNDEKEKRQRQLNRLQQQIQSRNFSSPTATPSDRRKSNAVAGLTNQELSEHYSKCIQLNTENKISVKNAFNLQLIDYMSEMLKRKDSDMNNFQVASCTLDASTKIYAYRVDSVHTDTLKMAGGLGRTQEKKDEDEDLAEGDERTIAKKKKTRKKAVIETNLKNIDIGAFDLEFDVDPLFKKMTSQFDEGSSGRGQFLNTLQLKDDSCQMMLDAETVLFCDDHPVSGNDEKVAVPKISDLKQKLICPTFSLFEFTKWKIGDEDTFCENSRMHHEEKEKQDGDHRFDVDAIPEPLEDDNYDADDGFGMDTAAGEYGEDENGTVITIGQGGCHKAPPLMEAVHLKDHLSENPSEYSYFDQNRMLAWAGPQHWRLKPLSKVKSDANPEEVKRKKKVFVTLDYEKDPEIDKYFEVTRKTTKLTQTTLRSWSSAKTTYPIDLHYDSRNFTKLFGRPAIIIRRQRKAAAVDDSVTDYNYDNPNDADNYCADVEDTNSNYGDATVGYDMTEIFSQTVLGGSQPANGENDIGSGNLFDNLVAAPNKVAKINIGYARQAKRIDMKKLKATVWTMLSDTSLDKENNQGLENRAETNREPRDEMDPSYNIEFNKLYKTLPSKLSAKMTESLSVPLAFIALLHLANEHSLQLTSLGELEDFVISQG